MRKTKPYIIAEIGVNYYDTAKAMGISPMDAAKLYIDKAADNGIDCAKFQSYKAETIVSKHSPAYWDTIKEPTKSQYELFKKFDHFGYEEYAELSEYSHSKGMDFTSTPFDYNAVDYLEDLVDFYKISSSDLSNIPFIVSWISTKIDSILITDFVEVDTTTGLLGILQILILNAHSSRNFISVFSGNAFDEYSLQRHLTLQIAFSSNLSQSHLSTQLCNCFLRSSIAAASSEAPFDHGTSSASFLFSPVRGLFEFSFILLLFSIISSINSSIYSSESSNGDGISSRLFSSSSSASKYASSNLGLPDTTHLFTYAVFQLFVTVLCSSVHSVIMLLISSSSVIFGNDSHHFFVH